MTAGLTTIWLGLLLAWILWGLAGLILPGPAAIAVGALSSAVAVWAFRDTLVLRGVVAVLGSFRVVLAFLVLRHMATGLGIEVMPFGTVELVVFVLAYGAFLATATGTLPADIYRLGYAPLPVGVMVLAVCGYGMVQGSPFVPLVAVAGQAFWAFRLGSSNWFDHVLHAGLVPVAGVVLILRVF